MGVLQITTKVQYNKNISASSTYLTCSRHVTRNANIDWKPAFKRAVTQSSIQTLKRVVNKIVQNYKR